ncbi:unnamed protein product [Albugo candida]|uniref:Uncharacterized protein n=1 Tax=Albugo candida TaxID=65357 RepID=A0A024GHY4_9STRA|nr:unnamed protein product [Albugo candida]|eukprot:CCI46380.1 unnamed protein product [Albugo candida]
MKNDAEREPEFALSSYLHAFAFCFESWTNLTGCIQTQYMRTNSSLCIIYLTHRCITMRIHIDTSYKHVRQMGKTVQYDVKALLDRSVETLTNRKTLDWS